MATALLGLVLDSSTAIAAERSKQSVAELVHGIFRARTPAAAQSRRLFVEELLSLVPVHPFTRQTGWLVGQIDGQEAAKGNLLPFSDLIIGAAALEQG